MKSLPRPERRGDRLAWQKAVAAALFDQGCAAPSWPEQWGGMALSPWDQVIYHEEMAVAGVSPHPDPSVWIAGPTIIAHGTTEQKERFLRPMLRADLMWCQGFSEPDAGSDLPALKTTAVRDGDTYVVNGQKIWTSRAHQADFMYGLVRTGDPQDREHNITYLIIDMRSEGITVNPVRDMAGQARFNQVFFDNVVVPVENRVGEENEGWPIARTSLGHERSTGFIGQSVRYRRILDELGELARQRGRSSHAVTRQGLAQLECEARLLTLNGFRNLQIATETGSPGPISSVTRLFHARFEKKLHELAVDILGASGLLAADDPHAPDRGRWTWGFLMTRASTIGAGTAEIQLNTIGEKVLGLPHEPAVK